ncbi:MAG: DNA-binding response regulator [Calditrichaeota bacterium]|nr:MAG: DNA-binding response regulator [Calditrichota bacterium]
MKINCIIVDDEPAAQEILQKYIADCPWLNLVKTCSNAFEAADTLNHEKIELIFLDINMPKLSGMSLYKSLSNPPRVIFTTAYPEFAVEGFEVSAADFLLKPFPFERFLKAVNKVVGAQQNQPSKLTESADAYILLKSDKKIHHIKLNEIIHLEAIGDYIEVHLRRSSLTVHETLKAMLEQLPASHFTRIHKSYIIALDKIEFIEGNRVRIRDKYLPIGKVFREDFLVVLQKRKKVTNKF